MKIVVIGKSGQLATELQQLLPASAVFLGRDDVDITQANALADTLQTYRPDAIINAAAYTAVDKAESEPDAAFAVNATGVQNLATYCKAQQVFLVHVSTDYVFNGHKGVPYTPEDTIEPQGVYGKSKAQGEQALLALLPHQSCLLRTAWVYSSYGNNFVKTMLKLMASKRELGVIDEQIGTPTWARGLAEACYFAVQHQVKGVYHWTDEGVASWYDFAQAIQEVAIDKGLLSQAIPILPIPSSQYPTPAKRPHYSVLDKTATREAFAELQPAHWRVQLASMMDQLVESEK